MKGLKVLHLIDSGGLYGAEKMLLALVKEQIRQGLEPMILSAGEPGIDEKALEIEAHRLELPVISWRMRAGLNLTEGKKVAEWARAEGYRILHSHGYKFNILIGLMLCPSSRVPMLTTLHGYVKAPFLSKMWFYEWLDRLALLRMDRVVLVRPHMDHDIGFVSRGIRLSTVVNGIDLDSIRPFETSGLKPEVLNLATTHSPLIGAVGRLSPEKGLETLIDAFADLREEFPSAGLVIVGEGRERESLEHQIKARGLADCVILPGYCDNVPAMLNLLDVLAMPSRTEGLPVTLLEAMVVGTPIVASAVGGIPALLNGGQLGYLTEAGNIGSLKSALGHCLRDRLGCMGKRKEAISVARAHYSSARMAAHYGEIYAQVS